MEGIRPRRRALCGRGVQGTVLTPLRPLNVQEAVSDKFVVLLHLV
jgi:hypothetical protein